LTGRIGPVRFGARRPPTDFTGEQPGQQIDVVTLATADDGEEGAGGGFDDDVGGATSDRGARDPDPAMVTGVRTFAAAR
jgi:hypothetical protein